MHLISVDDMTERFQNAWAHLRKWEKELRNRESKGFDDEQWYRFGRSQNIDKQDIPKLIVAQTVPEMRVSADYLGVSYLNNVRVNGILARSGTDQSFLLGALNGRVADFVFRRIGKPKQGGWYEANKQFIAPLPIPRTSPEGQANLATAARRLQDRWTNRRDLLRQVAERLAVLARSRHPAHWLWPDLPSLPEMIERAPRGLRMAGDRRRWADERLNELEASRLEALQAVLDRGGRREVRFADGELRLYVSGAVVLDKIFLDETTGRLTETYWRWLLLSGPAREAERIRGGPAPSARTDRRTCSRAIPRPCRSVGRRGRRDRSRRARHERGALRAL